MNVEGPEVIVPGPVLEAWGLGPGAQRLGRGRINLTFFAPRPHGNALVIQCLNPRVFPDPSKVMDNLQKVLAHLPQGPLQLVHAKDGSPWIRDEQGAAWRAWLPIEGRILEGPATPAEARACAGGFGSFAAALRDLDPGQLHVILPAFHHTPSRLAAFEAAAAQAPSYLDSDRERLVRLAHLAPALQGLPLRVAHEDTKLDNVLLHPERDEALAVLDLDTVQPGSWATDFGDMVRSACNPLGEEADPADLPEPDPERFAALAEGFLRPLAPHLALEERERLALAPAVLAYELALRFLTDHLQGDPVFRVQRPGQNLDRARLQLSLAEAFMRSQATFQRIISALSH